MIYNILNIIFRNTIRQKAFSIINILGLSIGMAVSILILLYVKDELSFDRYHEHSDRIYRVTREWLNDDGKSSLHLARVAPPIATLLKSDFAEAIEEINRVFGGFDALFKFGVGADEVSYIEKRAYYTDANFFKIFSAEVLKGDLATALTGPGKVVITESTAQKYFDDDDDDPIGKELRGENFLDNSDIPLIITAVVKDFPANSHFRPEILVSLETFYPIFGKEYFDTNWGSNNFATYILFAENYKASDLGKQFPEFLNRHLGAYYDGEGDGDDLKPSDNNILHLQKLTDIHLRSHLSTELSDNGDIVNVRLFSAVAIFILLIACINFMNLSTARSVRRAKEVGVRKVLGAFRSQLILQFIFESLFMAAISLVLALVMVEFSLGYFNSFVGKNLQLSLFSDRYISLGLMLLTLITGVVAGSYPAFYLSSFRPIAVLKSDTGVGRSGWAFRKILVLFQFSIAIILIISMIVIHKQRNFMLDKELGYDHEQILILPSDPGVMKKMETLKSEMLSNPSVISVSGSSLVPSERLLNSQGGRLLDGDKPEPIGFRLSNVDVDYDFFNTYGIEMAAGRNFSRDFSNDDSASFILNESAVKRFGWDEPQNAIHRRLEYAEKQGRIVGVVKDFHFESLHYGVDPIIFRIDKGNLWNVSVKISGKNIKETIDFIEEIWKQYRPGYPFEFSFLDQRLNNLYSREQRLGSLFNIFSALAIFIGLLGLFGMASFSSEQRTREIGIRKVFGVGVSEIILLLSREFTKWVLLANVIAWPVAWLMADAWLDTFANRILMPYWAFVAAGVVSFLLAIATVSWQAARAAKQNPVISLKYE